MRYLKTYKSSLFSKFLLCVAFFGSTQSVFAGDRCKITNLAEFIKTLGEFQKLKGYPKTTKTLSFLESPQQIFERLFENFDFTTSSNKLDQFQIQPQQQTLFAKILNTANSLKQNPSDGLLKNKLHSQLIQALTDTGFNFEFLREGKNSYIVILPDSVTPIGKYLGTILELSPSFSVRINLDNLESLNLDPGPHNVPSYFQMRNMVEIPLSSLIRKLPNSEPLNPHFSLTPVVGGSLSLFAIRSFIIHNTRLNKKPYLNALRTFKDSQGNVVQVPLAQTFAVPFLGHMFFKEPLGVLKTYVGMANKNTQTLPQTRDAFLPFLTAYKKALDTHKSWIDTQSQYLEVSLDNVSTYINEFELIRSSYDDPFKGHNHWGFSKVYKDSAKTRFDRNILTLVDSQSFTPSSPGEENKIYALFNLENIVFGLGHIEAKGDGFEYLDVVIRHHKNSEISFSLTAPHLISLVKKHSLTDLFLPEDKDANYLITQAITKQLGAIMQHLMFEQKLYQIVYKSLATIDFHYSKLMDDRNAPISHEEFMEHLNGIYSESMKIDNQYQSMLRLMF